VFVEEEEDSDEDDDWDDDYDEGTEDGGAALDDNHCPPGQYCGGKNIQTPNFFIVKYEPLNCSFKKKKPFANFLLATTDLANCP